MEITSKHSLFLMTPTETITADLWGTSRPDFHLGSPSSSVAAGSDDTKNQKEFLRAGVAFLLFHVPPAAGFTPSLVRINQLH